MSAESLTEEQRAQRWRQRLWGATILIAIAVIVLPLLLDGSGSESQFRRVESLRQEPTRVINSDGSRRTVAIPESAPATAPAPLVESGSLADNANSTRSEGFFQRLKRRFTESPKQNSDARVAVQSGAVEELVTPSAVQIPQTAETEAELPSSADSDNEISDYRAWVVQAGSFREEINALAVRDRLRRDGYPSFVTLSNDGAVFRVRVGPMVNKAQAGRVQNNVMELLGREAIVMPYP